MFGLTEPIVQKPTLSVCRRSAVVNAFTSAECQNYILNSGYEFV